MFSLPTPSSATMVMVSSRQSTGQNTATSDKFPNRILTETYDAGFNNTLFMKDLKLYLESVQTDGQPDALGAVCADVWRRFVRSSPGADFTKIYRFIRDKGWASSVPDSGD